MNTIKLHNAIAEVCPINGISIGKAANKETWIFHALENATHDQIVNAQAVIDNADISILNEIKYITKLTIVDRLIALGKLSDALTALNSDVVGKARWDASSEIDTEDEQVKSLLTACGIDPKDVLY